MIVVPTGNPLRVNGLANLGRPEVYVALGAVGVPAGDYGRQVLAKAGVAVTPKSLEPSVSAIVSKAALREIEAGIVYVTDAAIALSLLLVAVSLAVLVSLRHRLVTRA